MPIIDEKEKNILTDEENEILKKAEEIKLKIAMAEQEERMSDLKSSYEVIPHEKLLPFLNAKAQYHTSRLETLKDKRDTLTAKIEKNQAKIEKLTAKAERLEDMNRMLSAIALNIPGVKNFIERNEKKIKAIREDKIPNRRAKVEKHKNRISEIDRKSAFINHKLERCTALSDTIKSFAIIGAERRKAFAESMNRLNASTYNCVKDRLDRLKENAAADPQKAYQYRSKITKLEQKLDKLEKLAVKYKDLSVSQIDKAMRNSEESINADIEKGSSIAEMADNVIENNNMDAELHNIDELNQLKGKNPALSSEIDQMLKSLQEQAAKELDKLKKQAVMQAVISDEQALSYSEIKALATGNEHIIDNILKSRQAKSSENQYKTNVQEESKKEFQQNTVINSDYYKKIPAEKRCISTFSKTAGLLLINNLNSNDIPYSASINNSKNSITITVSKENEKAFNQIKQQLSKEKIQSYNPEYFKNLPQDKRFVQAGLTEQEVKNLKTDLDKQGIKCSFIQNGEKSKITISKDDTHKLNDKTKAFFISKDKQTSINKKIENQNKNKEKSVKTRSREQEL